MSTPRMAGIAWVVAALLSVVTTLAFRVDSAQVISTMAGGAGAAFLGVWLISRPSAAAAMLSTMFGIVWLALYAVLTVVQLDDPAAWTTDVFLALVGMGAALGAYRSRQGRPVGVGERAGR